MNAWLDGCLTFGLRHQPPLDRGENLVLGELQRLDVGPVEVADVHHCSVKGAPIVREVRMESGAVAVRLRWSRSGGSRLGDWPLGVTPASADARGRQTTCGYV